MSLETMALLNDDPIVKLPAMAAGVLSVSRISLPWLSDRSRLPDQAGFVLPRFPACTSRLATARSLCTIV
jgi:hypothetical protein